MNTNSILTKHTSPNQSQNQECKHTKCPLNIDWIKMAAASSPGNLVGLAAWGTNSGEDRGESTITSSSSSSSGGGGRGGGGGGKRFFLRLTLSTLTSNWGGELLDEATNTG